VLRRVAGRAVARGHGLGDDEAPVRELLLPLPGSVAVEAAHPLGGVAARLVLVEHARRLAPVALGALPGRPNEGGRRLLELALGTGRVEDERPDDQRRPDGDRDEDGREGPITPESGHRPLRMPAPRRRKPPGGSYTSLVSRPCRPWRSRS